MHIAIWRAAMETMPFILQPDRDSEPRGRCARPCPRRARTDRGAVDRTLLLGVGGILLAGILGGGIKFLLDRAGPHPERAPPEESVAATMPGTAPPPVKIRWAIRTEPAGADVVRLSDGKVMSKTPFEHEHTLIGQGHKVALALRLEGYAEKRLELDTSQNVDLLEKLEPAGKEDPMQEEGGGKKKRKKKKK
ncbi:MAG: hypothetical protein NZ890_18605 [Myxococcota bacterium]|nr:hypothetical protein [Myxococcota bacterium]